jgi:hypothetical protein
LRNATKTRQDKAWTCLTVVSIVPSVHNEIICRLRPVRASRLKSCENVRSGNPWKGAQNAERRAILARSLLFWAPELLCSSPAWTRIAFDARASFPQADLPRTGPLHCSGTLGKIAPDLVFSGCVKICMRTTSLANRRVLKDRSTRPFGPLLRFRSPA